MKIVIREERKGDYKLSREMIEEAFKRQIFSDGINIKVSFNVPDNHFMALELHNNSLKNISGTMVYAKEFFS